MEREPVMPETSTESTKADDSFKTTDDSQSYKTNHEFLEQEFARLKALISLKLLISEQSGFETREERRQNLRKGDFSGRDEGNVLITRARKEFLKLEEICKKRLKSTKQKNYDFLPLEKLAEQYEFDALERDIFLMLVARTILPEFQELGRNMNVGLILKTLAENPSEYIAFRRYFYKSSRLVQSGLIDMDTHVDNLYTAAPEIDTRIVDIVLGLDSEISEFIESSHLYSPTVSLDRVMLSWEQKNLVIRTVENFEAFRETRAKLGINEMYQYGTGLIMLFYGMSGTGKTMMANALASHLKKRLLLVNYPNLGHRSDERLRTIFREARLRDAILFFDECDEMLSYRNPLLLTEIERHEGLIIMATNKPEEIEEAMHRRITLAVEFHTPDAMQRENIWRAHIPVEFPLEGDINLKELSEKYEISGGLIKNAVLMALSEAVARDTSYPRITQNDLAAGAKLQLKGQLQLSQSNMTIVPKAGLEQLVLPEKTLKTFREIITYQRARAILYNEWGLRENDSELYGKGTTIFLHGAPGTGKTLAAQSLAYELGKTLRIVNTAEVTSKYVGETAKILNQIFDDAKRHDSILFFDEADALFAGRTNVRDSTDRYANSDINMLLTLIEKSNSFIILTSNLMENIDAAFMRRFHYVIEFAKPDKILRVQLWKSLLPQKLPMENSINIDTLAEINITGANIKNAIFRASVSALSRKPERQIVTQQDLAECAKEELLKTGSSKEIGFGL